MAYCIRYELVDENWTFAQILDSRVKSESETRLNGVLVVPENIHKSMTIIDRATDRSLTLLFYPLYSSHSFDFHQTWMNLLVVTIPTLTSSFLHIDIFSKLFSLAGIWMYLAFKVCFDYRLNFSRYMLEKASGYTIFQNCIYLDVA